MWEKLYSFQSQMIRNWLHLLNFLLKGIPKGGLFLRNLILPERKSAKLYLKFNKNWSFSAEKSVNSSCWAFDLRGNFRESLEGFLFGMEHYPWKNAVLTKGFAYISERDLFSNKVHSLKVVYEHFSLVFLW